MEKSIYTHESRNFSHEIYIPSGKWCKTLAILKVVFLTVIYNLGEHSPWKWFMSILLRIKCSLNCVIILKLRILSLLQSRIKSPVTWSLMKMRNNFSIEYKSLIARLQVSIFITQFSINENFAHFWLCNQ